MKKLVLYIVALFSMISLASCAGGSGSTKALLPNVSGKAGEVIVVIEKADWDGALGTEVREVLACECPWLVQSEPLYSLVNVAPGGFTDLFKYHRNIVAFHIDPQIVKPGLVYKNDVWASPQVVLQISAHTSEEALEIFKENEEIVTSSIEQAERDRVIHNTMLYEERPLFDKVCEIMGGSPHFPSGYSLKSAREDFVWISDEKPNSLIQSILIYKYPVKESDDFSADAIIRRRNEILQVNVPGMFENTYMTTSDFFPVTVEYIKYKGRDFAQTRGFWEVYNDYMGGPFVSHTFYSQDGSEMIVTEAFVYAPKYDKRQYLRQVESLLYSFEWKK